MFEALTGSDAKILHGKRLSPRRTIHMDWEVPGRVRKRPFCPDFPGENLFGLTSVEDRVRIQLQIVTTFLKGGGQFWVLKAFWAQVGI